MRLCSSVWTSVHWSKKGWKARKRAFVFEIVWVCERVWGGLGCGWRSYGPIQSTWSEGQTDGRTDEWTKSHTETELRVRNDIVTLRHSFFLFFFSPPVLKIVGIIHIWPSGPIQSSWSEGRTDGRTDAMDQVSHRVARPQIATKKRNEADCSN